MIKPVSTIVVALLAIATWTGEAPRADEQPACQARVVATGGAHKIKSVAELNALRAWMQGTQRFGEAYGMWHNATGTSMSCDSIGQGYYRCAAAGKPCLPRAAQSAAAN